MRPRLEILSAEELDSIHEASIRILEETGIIVENHEIVALLADKGCTVSNQRVRIPAMLVEEILAQPSPPYVNVGRHMNRMIQLDGDRVYTQSIGGVPYILDFEIGQRRGVEREDVANMTRILNKLDHVHYVSGAIPKDVPPEVASIVMVKTVLENTSKPVRWAVESGTEAAYIISLAEAVVGGSQEHKKRPIVSIVVSPISPLQFPGSICEALSTIAQAETPTGILPCPILGMTVPVTLAGALAQQNAEILAGLVILRSLNPKVPVCYQGRISCPNMRTGAAIWGNPELGISSAATVQLARRYGLPCDVGGLTTSSKMVDVQTGYEKMMNALMPALAGADVLLGIGGMDDCLTTSYEQLIIDDEMYSLIFRILSGVAVSRETLALQSVSKAVSGEPFLTQEHTREFFRQGAIWAASMGVRDTFEEWRERGTRSALQRAKERVAEILSTHEPEPLDRDTQYALDEIVRQAERELVD